MVNNELFDWIATLQLEERESFSSYLQSSEHQRKKLPIRLYAWLMAHPEAWQGPGGWESKRKLQSDLHAWLFPKKDFKPQRIRRVVMDLKQILEEFIALKAAPRLPIALDQEIKLLKYLLERGATALFEKRLTVFEHYLQASAPLAPDTYLASMWAAQMRSEFCIHQNLPNDGFERTNLLAAQHYLVHSLQNFTAMRVREQYYSKTNDYLFEPEVLSMATSLTSANDGLIALWKSVYDLVAIDAQPTHYLETQTRLAQLKGRLPLLTTRQIRGHMFNYMVKTQELGSQDYYHRLWELLCAMLAEGTLHMPDGRMTIPFFISTVRAACLSGQHAWAVEFIARYARDIVGNGKDEQIRYCQLLAAFHAGQLHETWHALLTFSPQDRKIDSFARTLQVQIAYDLGKEDEFARLVEALGKFIIRNEVLGARFISLVQEFCRFAERLGHARFISQKLPKGLEARLKARDCTEKIWLLAKVRELAHS